MELAAQAVEAEFDGAEAHPFAPAENARAARLDPALRRDREADRATEIDPVRTVIEVDQHGERVTGTALTTGCLRHRLGALARDLDRRHEAQRVPQFGRIARDDAAAEHGLGPRQRRDAGSNLAAGKGFDDRERTAAVAQRLQNDAFERVVVLGHYEIA